MSQELKKYAKFGYVKFKKVFSKEFCQKMFDASELLEPKVKIPFSNVAWGYGQLFDIKPFDQIVNNEKINSFIESVLGEDFIFNHLMLNNKAPFIGPEEIWHQEVYNINTFAPGTDKKNWNRFMQVFIAIDDHSLTNGCLRLIPESHKLGELNSVDVVTGNQLHKRRTSVESLIEATKKLEIKNCVLRKGDVLFFNHLLLHSSSSNPSKHSRKALVMQAQSKEVSKKDTKIFELEVKHRRNFITSEYQKKIESLNKKSNQMYADFSKKK